MTLLQLQEGTKSYGSRVLFDKASFAINEGEHLGVIGPNGAGKTTLFKILAQQEELDSGIVTRSHSLRMGYLEQEADWNIDQEVEAYLSENCLKPIWELKQLGQKLGLTETHFDSFLKELSGGYRMRVKLLFLLGQEPNLLLLDEPTNFLDLETLLVLEQFLQNYAGAFLLISHDREFLRRVTDHIVEVEGGEIIKYAGNLDDYFEQKAMLREILEKQLLSQDAKRRSVLDFVSRFGAKATKAKQAQSRLKSLDKMEKIEVKALPTRAVIKIPPAFPTGKMILELEKGSCGYEHKRILENVELRLERGHHLGIVGLNGAGKSTLLKTLAQDIPLLSGKLSWGHQVQYSYYAQHTPEKLNLNDTVIEAMSREIHRDVVYQDVLNMAGSLLFSGDAVYKKVKVLSGGEKSRVALGQILLKKSPLLLLDEPTNHLDFDTVEALTVALENYDGTIVTVSHDRGFIGRAANRILEVHNGQLSLYPGTYDEYVWSLQKGVLSEREFSATDERLSQRKEPQESSPKVNLKEERKKLEANLRSVQKQMKDLEKKLQVNHEKRQGYLDDLTTATGENAAHLGKELHLLSSLIETFEENLLELMEQESQLQAQLETLLK